MTALNHRYYSQLSIFEYIFKDKLKQLSQNRWGWFLCLFCGAMVPLSFAPFNTYSSLFVYLIFLPLALFVYQTVNAANTRQAFYRGLLFGVGLFGVGVSWLYIAIHDYGAAHWSLASAFTGLFIVFMSTYYAAFSALIYTIKKQLNVSDSALFLFYIPVLWVFFEWLRSWLFTGFPWIISGYPLIETPLAGFAPVVGIYGLSLLVILLACLLLVRLRFWIISLLLVFLFSSAYLLQQVQWSKSVGEPLSIALIQGNVNQSIKWSRYQLEKTKQLYVDLSKDQWHTNDLIIWPENAIPVFYHTLETGYYHALTQQAKKSKTELITGLPIFDDKTQQYYNSLITLGGEPGHYYKTHLVPFGEYVPLAALIRDLIKFFNMPMSGFSPGEANQPPLKIKDYQAVITLCYEDVFAQDILKHIPDAQFMINLSNNGWYGDSFAPHQHLEMARMRALETSREVIRSTTSGISAIIDAQGEIKVKGPQFETAIINGQLQARTGTTPYVFWANYPLLLLFLIAFLLLYKNWKYH